MIIVAIIKKCPLYSSYLPPNKRPAGYVDKESIAYKRTQVLKETCFATAISTGKIKRLLKTNHSEDSDLFVNLAHDLCRLATTKSITLPEKQNFLLMLQQIIQADEEAVSKSDDSSTSAQKEEKPPTKAKKAPTNEKKASAKGKKMARAESSEEELSEEESSEEESSDEDSEEEATKEDVKPTKAIVKKATRGRPKKNTR